MLGQRWGLHIVTTLGAVLLFAAVAAAETTVTITLTDEQAAALATRATSANNATRGRKTPNVAPVTPAQHLQQVVSGMLDTWVEAEHQAAADKTWDQLTPDQRTRHCRRMKMGTCPP